jgi:uncharacterized protein (DUF1684 family)
MERFIDELTEFRQQKDRFFKTDPYAPLTPQQQASFDGLAYYEPNAALSFELKPEPFADQTHIKMQTSKGEVRSYLRWGRVKFQVEGQDAALTLYMTPGEPAFFVPFKDATSGSETYGAGRYVEVERLPNGNLLLDFNAAYNPYCAYSSPQSLRVGSEDETNVWSCPLPPSENHLTVPIRAGEKKPRGEWVAE